MQGQFSPCALDSFQQKINWLSIKVLVEYNEKHFDTNYRQLQIRLEI